MDRPGGTCPAFSLLMASRRNCVSVYMTTGGVFLGNETRQFQNLLRDFFKVLRFVFLLLVLFLGICVCLQYSSK
jgi:hypothetical protein